MLGRKPLMNIAPEGYRCPACGSPDLSCRKGGWARLKCGCADCGLSFSANIGMSDEEYEEACGHPCGPIVIEWRDCASPMDAVRRFAVRNDPHLAGFADDPEVFAWICDYWDYVIWNEHGNDPSYDWLAFEGGFGDIVRQIVYDPGAMIDYLGGWTSPEDLPEREKDLITGLRRINRRLAS